ncbi:hypothetical protein ALC62_06865 [Cyphomyrmex costatus]|uniref:Uncharacterized protein n=1 Tax=Cyphomyrmex costatus TaxID=456900 RepID=A0A151IID0_9HYME|nr:hypothetical protein ALC62_06865 [Cyphomyrmex costatus]
MNFIRFTTRILHDLRHEFYTLLIHSHACDDERLPGWHDSLINYVLQMSSHRVINERRHKPSRELGHLGYAVTTRQCIVDAKNRWLVIPRQTTKVCF